MHLIESLILDLVVAVASPLLQSSLCIVVERYGKASKGVMSILP